MSLDADNVKVGDVVSVLGRDYKVKAVADAGIYVNKIDYYWSKKKVYFFPFTIGKMLNLSANDVRQLESLPKIKCSKCLDSGYVNRVVPIESHGGWNASNTRRQCSCRSGG